MARYGKSSAMGLLSLACVFGLKAQPPIIVPQQWRTAGSKALFLNADFDRLPFLIRDQVLMGLDSQYHTLPWTKRRKILVESDKQAAASQGRRALQPIIWNNDGKESTSYFAYGQHFYDLMLPSFNLGVTVGHYEKHIRVWIYAVNAADSKLRFDILAKNVSLSLLQPKVETCEREDAEKIAKSIRRGASWKAAIIGGLGGMATTTVTSEQHGSVTGQISGSDGSSASYSGDYSGTSTTRVPDYEARRRAAANAAQVRADAQLKSVGVANTALADTTLFPGRSINGFVYFKRSDIKPSSVAVLQVIIGGASFEFPIQF